MPMTDDNSSDTLPTGMCIDFTPQNHIVISEYQLRVIKQKCNKACT